MSDYYDASLANAMWDVAEALKETAKAQREFNKIFEEAAKGFFIEWREHGPK